MPSAVEQSKMDRKEGDTKAQSLGEVRMGSSGERKHGSVSVLSSSSRTDDEARIAQLEKLVASSSLPPPSLVKNRAKESSNKGRNHQSDRPAVIRRISNPTSEDSQQQLTNPTRTVSACIESETDSPCPTTVSRHTPSPNREESERHGKRIDRAASMPMSRTTSSQSRGHGTMAKQYEPPRSEKEISRKRQAVKYAKPSERKSSSKESSRSASSGRQVARFSKEDPKYWIHYHRLDKETAVHLARKAARDRDRPHPERQERPDHEEQQIVYPHMMPHPVQQPHGPPPQLVFQQAGIPPHFQQQVDPRMFHPQFVDPRAQAVYGNEQPDFEREVHEVARKSKHHKSARRNQEPLSPTSAAHDQQKRRKSKGDEKEALQATTDISAILAQAKELEAKLAAAEEAKKDLTIEAGNALPDSVECGTKLVVYSPKGHLSSLVSVVERAGEMVRLQYPDGYVTDPLNLSGFKYKIIRGS